ncbi:MAG: L-aspartate oxidase [Acidiferrobacterales bacterium]|jgi:L-aspartate oxidase|nr:L-aspartate oxidase [Acidiferrobacterales bacterium]
MPKPRPSQVLVIGAGIAGLTLALRLAATSQVTVLAKARLTEGSSLYAQGGVAAVLDAKKDSLSSHVEDTLNAGAGLCDEDTVRFVVEHGPEAIHWLIDEGVPFTKVNHDEATYHLTREGGHSHRRVIHAADETGRAIENTLESQVRQHPNIRLLEHHIAIDLITRHKTGLDGENRCLGAYVLDKEKDRVEVFAADFTVLATGGASKVYLYTSNPDTSTGDGVAIAWRAGCRVANMEFVQFHPTCLYHPHAKSFLISEAVRGEGGKLTLPDGSSFMENHDSRAELAPRDIVARAIDYEMKKHGLDHVLLDISHKSPEFINEHFPHIYKVCLHLGYDITREPIPVVPAAHYTCGGVITDHRGRTDLAALYSIGECAHTGLHGANRLASNSLLECVVFAQSAAEDIDQRQDPSSISVSALPPWDESRVTDPDEEVVVSHNWDELRRFMWDYVGIVRTDKRLERALHRAHLLQAEIREFYTNFRVSNDLIELRNLVMVAELIIRSAQARKESRGLHYTRDYPTTRPGVPENTVMIPDNFAASVIEAA